MATGTIPNSSLTGNSLFNNHTPYYISELPSGIASGLNWSTAGPSGTYLSSVSVPGLTASSIVTASVTYANGVVNTTDALNSWLVSTYTGANQINFQVAAQPTTPASFCIAWQVLKY